MPSLETTIRVSAEILTNVPSLTADQSQWALPVRIDILGAHLEAHVETLLTISALRLCNKFGSGPQCFVNKLPAELVSIIEDFVVEPVRKRAHEIHGQRSTNASSSNTT
jgi:hypothetical protein